MAGGVPQQGGCEGGSSAGSLYDTLGLEPSATAEEIRRAYRRLSLRFHPDKVPDEGEKAAAREKFIAVARAYEVLSDEERRREYDRHGENGLAGVEASPPEDVFTHSFQGAVPIVLSSPGGRDSGGHGGVIRTMIRLPLEDFVFGKSLAAVVNRAVLCDVCDGCGFSSVPEQCELCYGSGYVQPANMPDGYVMACPECSDGGRIMYKVECGACAGAGMIDIESTVTVRPPPGDNWHSICAKQLTIQKGAPDGQLVSLGVVGDDDEELVVQLSQIPHPAFSRLGCSLLTSVKVDLADALMGKGPTLTHMDGRKISLRCRDGEVLRPGWWIIPGEGAPCVGSPLKGDMWVKVKVKFPDTVSSSAARSFAEALVPPISDTGIALVGGGRGGPFDERVMMTGSLSDWKGARMTDLHSLTCEIVGPVVAKMEGSDAWRKKGAHLGVCGPVGEQQLARRLLRGPVVRGTRSSTLQLHTDCYFLATQT